MENHHIRLTSSEIGGLWANYLSDSLYICVYKYYLATVEDAEIKTVLEHALDLSQQHVKVISDIFKEEGHIIPHGFTDEDVNVNSPRLFSDEFFLLYTRQMTKGALATYSVILPHTFRKDVKEHFMSCISSTMELFNETASILLSKGLEIRSPYIPYLEEVNMVEQQGFIAGWWGKQRPLTASEVTHLFSNIQTNHLGSAMATAFGQVVKSEEIKKYMKRGKAISKKHVEIFSKYLIENDLPAPTTWDAHVQPVKEPPFSDKLMMFHISLMVAAGVGNYGTALSASMRRDIGVDYTRLLGEIGLYAEDGMNLLIKNEWLERPPFAADRNQLMN
ncbi:MULTISPECIES: DUF3231 family protein [unclassified Niallia]|uniref:DUF3231 family protein n=1 Tax=Niallia TaxID=2837506 RepID=UPI001EDC47DB|nr:MULTISPECIES: DUF3231 family protein [unclassified Niallia]MCM3033970.1 DUF3231 family protein [Niallia sp. MER 6]UPO90078.1 DUF3231 family protein [Niallia sp. Man26]